MNWVLFWLGAFMGFIVGFGTCALFAIASDMKHGCTDDEELKAVVQRILLERDRARGRADEMEWRYGDLVETVARRTDQARNYTESMGPHGPLE